MKESFCALLHVKGTFVIFLKKKIQKLGIFRKTSYLCSVRMTILAIRAESREGKTISTLPVFKAIRKVAFIISNTSS